MHIQPYPTTQAIKQQILVYAECNSSTEFKDKFAPDLVGKNTMAPLMTFLLNKVGFLFQHCTVQLQVPKKIQQPAVAFTSHEHRFVV
jgi:hypothetical protein